MHRFTSILGSFAFCLTALLASGCSQGEEQRLWVPLVLSDNFGVDPGAPVAIYIGVGSGSEMEESRRVFESARMALERNEVDEFLKFTADNDDARKHFEYLKGAFEESGQPESVFGFEVGDWHFHVVPMHKRVDDEYQQWRNLIPMLKTADGWKWETRNTNSGILNLRYLFTDRFQSESSSKPEFQWKEVLPEESALRVSLPLVELGEGASIEVALNVMTQQESLDTGVLEFARETMAMMEALDSTNDEIPEPLAVRIGDDSRAFILDSVLKSEFEFMGPNYKLNLGVPVVVDASPYSIVWVGEIKDERLELGGQHPMIFKNLPNGEWQWISFYINHFVLMGLAGPEFCQAFADALNEEGWATQ